MEHLKAFHIGSFKAKGVRTLMSYFCKSKEMCKNPVNFRLLLYIRTLSTTSSKHNFNLKSLSSQSLFQG
ncbi:MAG: hypothetical protein ACI9CQ_004391 [Saprospiraceae bacterium]|jgi:hypothetical protein